MRISTTQIYAAGLVGMEQNQSQLENDTSEYQHQYTLPQAWL